MIAIRTTIEVKTSANFSPSADETISLIYSIWTWDPRSTNTGSPDLKGHACAWTKSSNHVPPAIFYNFF